jgi:hypothetical protein
MVWKCGTVLIFWNDYNKSKPDSRGNSQEIELRQCLLSFSCDLFKYSVSRFTQSRWRKQRKICETESFQFQNWTSVFLIKISCFNCLLTISRGGFFAYMSQILKGKFWRPNEMRGPYLQLKNFGIPYT